MATKLDKTIKREIEMDGTTFTVTISPEGVKLTQKGFRKGPEMTWKELAARGEGGSTGAGGGRSPGGTGGMAGGMGGVRAGGARARPRVERPVHGADVAEAVHALHDEHRRPLRRHRNADRGPAGEHHGEPRLPAHPGRGGRRAGGRPHHPDRHRTDPRVEALAGVRDAHRGAGDEGRGE